MELHNYKSVLATTASISTILQFLTGTLVCLKIVRNKSVGDISSFPFVSGSLSTSLWLRYGFFLQDRSMILVNTVGATLFLAYVMVFIIYSIKKTAVVRQFMVCLISLLLVLFYIENVVDLNNAKKTLGLICCVFTLLFFASPLASFFHVVRTKNTECLPFPIILATFIVSMQWFLYGVILQDKFIQIPNFLGCLLSAFQLSLFCIYPKVPRSYSTTDLI